MRTVDHRRMRAPIEAVFAAASEVERWPELLPHYRWVTLRDGSNGKGTVEMAAWRPFGPVKYPTWWVSRMEVDRPEWQVRYRHIEGITRGMHVVWQLVAREGGTDVTIIHEWPGPRWPLIGGIAASWVIGPLFIRAIASRTLAGIARHVEHHHGF